MHRVKVVQKFIFNLIILLGYNLKRIFLLSNQQLRNPNCKIYPQAQIINSYLSNYNVIFNNVLLIDTKLGEHSYVQRNSSIINSSVGRFCSIASNVTIGPGIHKTDFVSTHPSFYLKNTPLVKIYSKKNLYPSSKRSIIGNDVWIGGNSIIIDGVEIGDGAIIAAGSVVTKNVAPYSIVGGVPAKLIKLRFDKKTISQLIELKWWDNEENWFTENYDKFTNPKDLIENFHK